MDDAVASALIEELDEKYPRFAHVDWSILGRQFRGHKALAARLESWIATAAVHDSAAVAGAATVGCTPRSKQILLSNLRRDSMGFWAGRALLDGWGIADLEVASALNECALGENRRAGWIAFLLPDVMDPNACRARLLDLLADPDVDRPDFVVRGLEQLGAVRENTAFAKIALARIGENRTFFEGQILEALIRWNPQEPRVRDLALRELQFPDGAHAAVAQGFADDAPIRQRVSELLSPLPSELRRVVADSLLRFGLRDPDTIETCGEFSWEREPDIAATTSLALHRALQGQGLVSEGRIGVLRAELSCYGHHHESRRQAAYVGALELERYELIDEATETIGDPVPLRVTLESSSGEPNRVLIREVLSHWPALEIRYPGAGLARFQGRNGVAASDDALPGDAWAEVADEVDRESGLERGIQNWLSKTESSPLEPSLLRYLSRREPGSLRLRQHCLRALNAEERAWNFQERLEVAAQILAQQFADDESLWQELEVTVRESAEVPYGAFLSLARVRPHSGAVRERADQLWRTPSGRPAPLVFAALCAVGATSDLLDQVSDYWGSGERVGVWLYRPLVDRLIRDSSARQAFEREAASHEVDAARVALSVPLAASGPLPSGVTLALEELLARETSGAEPARFTFDARSGTIRSIASVVIDLMQASVGAPL